MELFDTVIVIAVGRCELTRKDAPEKISTPWTVIILESSRDENPNFRKGVFENPVQTLLSDSGK